MIRNSLFILLSASTFILGGCKKDNRLITEEVSPLGYAFTHMPIWEDGVTDLTVAIAWDSDWSLDLNRNPLVPHIAVSVMQSGGTAGLGPDQVIELFEEKNAYAQIYATADMIVAETEFPNDYTDDILPVLTELFQKPTFDEAWIARSRDGAVEFTQGNIRSLWQQMWDVGRQALLSDGPQTDFANYFDVDQMKAITRDDLIAWHQRSFSAAPRAITVAGAIDVKDAGEIIDQILGVVQPDFVANAVVQPVRHNAKRIYLHIADAEKTVMGLVGKLPATTDGKDYQDLVALNLFAGGAGSPLFEAIRTDLGSSYGLSAGMDNFGRNQRLLYIGGEVETDKLNKAIDATLETYAAFLNQPNFEALSGITSRIAGGVRKNVQAVNTSARALLQLKIDNLDPTNFAKLADNFEGITEGEIKERLNTAYPKADEFLILAVGPNSEGFPDACVVKDLSEVAACE